MSVSKKQKTLYGRYDTYDIPDTWEGEERPSKAMRLSDVDVGTRTSKTTFSTDNRTATRPTGESTGTCHTGESTGTCHTGGRTSTYHTGKGTNTYHTGKGTNTYHTGEHANASHTHAMRGNARPMPRRLARHDLSGEHVETAEPSETSQPLQMPRASRGDETCGPTGMSDLPEMSGPRQKRQRNFQDPQDMEGHVSISSIRPDAEGEFFLVTLEGQTAEGLQQQRISVTAEQYTALELRVGPLSLEAAARLCEAGRFCRSLRKAMELLGYGDMSARRMAWKLSARGVDRAVAVEVAAYLVRRGLIRENDAAERRAMADAGKHWGPQRIQQDLRVQGYTEEAIRSAMGALLDPDHPDAPDFICHCATLIRRKYGVVPQDAQERRKMVAALTRQGYTFSQIREAVEMVNEQGNQQE